MNKVVIAILLVILSGPVVSDNISWLYGDWLLTYDPDGDTQDRITFEKGGQFVTTEVATGKKFDGMYVVRNNTIKVSLLNSGNIFYKFELSFDNKKDTLYYSGKDSKLVSHYTKVQ